VPDSCFIVFEGIDGSGTTTQCELLTQRLRDSGLAVTQTREPGGTPLSERIRALLLDPENPISDITEMLLYAASRAQHVADVILPALQRGDLVVSDRYLDSSIAYQGYARHLGADLVRQVNAPATAGCEPGLVVYLDLPVATARERCRGRGTPADRIEAVGDDFQADVASAYRRIAATGRNALLLDATVSRETIASRVWEATQARWPHLIAAA
jgi:dTMP kinase